MVNILDTIERLRQKPESDRRRVALLASAGITLVIVLVWLLSIKIVSSRPTSVATEALTPPKQDESLGAVIMLQANKQVKQIKKGWQKIFK